MKEIKKILVPIDFSENSSKLLDVATYFAGVCSAKLWIVFVAEDPFAYSGVYMPDTSIDMFEVDIFQEAEKKLENYLDEKMDKTVAFQGMVLQGHVAGEIIRFAAEENMDLIIIGTHGYKGFDKMIFGSVADKVVKKSPCPVMTINTYGKSER